MNIVIFCDLLLPNDTTALKRLNRHFDSDFKGGDHFNALNLLKEVRRACEYALA